jgi:succinate dehydrogenase hydrophobic anchor subunit
MSVILSEANNLAERQRDPSSPDGHRGRQDDMRLFMIPLSIILIIYLIIVVVMVVFTFFNLYHMWRFGTWSGANIFMIFVYILLLMAVAIVSYNYISSVDWGQSIF